MSSHIQINGKLYPVLSVWDEIVKNGRQAKRFDLEMSHAEAAEIFIDDIDITFIKSIEVYSYNGEEEEITYNEEKIDLSDFCIAGDIIDYRNGKISVYMEKTSQQDLLNIVGEKAITKRELTSFMNGIKDLCKAIPDELAINHTILFDSWKADTDYNIDDRVIYNNILYKVLQNHTSQIDWTPENASSLFSKVLININDNIIPPWEQSNSTNSYMIGDKVNHNNQNWISTIDNNVWEPGVYGWDLITE